MLLHTELHSAASRRGLPPELVNGVRDAINLVDLTRSDVLYAALPGRLRSAGAIHLAAIRLETRTLVAFDKELVRAATQAEVHTVTPGG